MSRPGPGWLASQGQIRPGCYPTLTPEPLWPGLMTGPHRPNIREQHRQVDVVTAPHPLGKGRPEPRALFPSALQCSADTQCSGRTVPGTGVPRVLVPWVPGEGWYGPLPTPGGNILGCKCAADAAHVSSMPNNNNNIMLPPAYGSRKVTLFFTGAPPPVKKRVTFPLPTLVVTLYYYYCSTSSSRW